MTFTGDQNLQDVSIETTPSLAGLVSVRPTQISAAFADQPQTVTLFILAPADAAPACAAARSTSAAAARK